MRDIVLMAILTVTPLALAMTSELLFTGGFDIVLGYLDMVLIGAGALLAYLAFGKWGSFKMPRERKAAPRLTIWYTLFGAMFTLFYGSLCMHFRDTAPEFDLFKQLSAMVFAPLVEELICRLLLTNIIKRGSDKKSVCVAAAVITTVVWIIPHAPASAFGFVRYLIPGLLASAVYQKTGSIRVCMINHFASNAAATLVYVIGLPVGSTAVLAAVSVMTVIAASLFAKEFARGFSRTPACRPMSAVKAV
jgi:membrane protease YdiL (CAAX protease family)